MGTADNIRNVQKIVRTDSAAKRPVKIHFRSYLGTEDSDCQPLISPAVQKIHLVAFRIDCHHIGLPESRMLDIEPHLGTGCHLDNDSVLAGGNLAMHQDNVTTDGNYAYLRDLLRRHPVKTDLKTETSSVGAVLGDRVDIHATKRIRLLHTERILVKGQ